MRSISAISSWQSQRPKAIGPGRLDALAPVEAIPPTRRNSRDMSASPDPRVLSGDPIVRKAASALPPADFNRQVFDMLAKAVRTGPEDAAAGPAIKAIHAYLLTATPLINPPGLGIDGYA